MWKIYIIAKIFKYESNGIIFVKYNSYFVNQIYDQAYFLDLVLA
jgi:hypothetical protein